MNKYTMDVTIREFVTSISPVDFSRLTISVYQDGERTYYGNMDKALREGKDFLNSKIITFDFYAYNGGTSRHLRFDI